MKRVEQHVIEQTHPQFRALDEMALASKNLWNLANYHVRQACIFQHTSLNNTAIFHRIKRTEAYQALPAKVANQVLLQIHVAWTAFFEAMEVYREHPERFGGRPGLPKYLHKTQGRNRTRCNRFASSRKQITTWWSGLSAQGKTRPGS